MRIALVHDYLTQYGGAEKVLEVLHEIWPEAPVYTLFYDKKKMGQHFKDWDIKVSPIQNLPLGVKKYRWYLPLMPSAVERFNLGQYDLVISNCSAYVKGVLTPLGSLHISYIHTPTRYLWSDTYQYIDTLKGVEKIVSKFLAPVLTYLRLWDRQAAQRPNQILANSQFVAKRIKHYYGRTSTVLYPPVETEKFHISKSLGDYFLVVSRFRPYKRVDLAIRAFNKLGKPLKIIGSGKATTLKKIAKSNIEFLGFLSDEKKAEYLARCQALIFPQEEDFGIVPVEAMASGRPVIAYQSGGALETVIEGETGMFFDEQSPEALADTVNRFKPEKYNPEKIRQHALKFSKERFKKEIKEFVAKSIEEDKFKK